MIPQKGYRRLRKGRVSIKNQPYLITTAVEDRWPAFFRPEAADIVLSSLQWFEKQGKFRLDAAVVMPDHLHFVGALYRDFLARIMQSIKGYTAYKINKLFKRKGSFWQPQYHDHAVRKGEDLNEVVLYTLQNPVRAGLVKDFHDYPYWHCRWGV